jgi:hypothetical protein
MKFQFGPEIISSYKRLSYAPWYALAEFIDNATQAYFNNKDLMDALYKKEKTSITVKIEFGKDSKGDYIRIEDNSIGMTKAELQNAVILGKVPKDSSGRSKYGIGLKTASCWFGDFWTVTTKKLDNENEVSIEFDVQKVAKNNLSLKETVVKKEKSLHYTNIEIRKLNHKIQGREEKKIIEYLSSIYRKDFSNFNLKLLFQGHELAYDYDKIKKRLLKNVKGERYEKNFSFKVGNKRVKGWAGVFEKGSRKDAGFAILQSNRVIKGHPDSYKPELLFGDQEGGANNLVSQRLVGEINMDGFDVSHTKDAILFSDEQKDDFEAKLLEELKDYRHIAQTYRKYKAGQSAPKNSDINAAINSFGDELRSIQIKELMSLFELPSETLIHKSNHALLGNVTTKFKPTLKAKINELDVSIYLVSEMSPNDPYVLIESTKSKKNVIVIINLSHPHWVQLKSRDSILNFIRHCTYDGVAEWKTYFKINKIDPDTVKLFKDQLLRIPFEMEANKA